MGYFWYPTSNPNGVLGYLLLIYIIKVPQNGVPIIDQWEVSYKVTQSKMTSKWCKIKFFKHNTYYIFLESSTWGLLQFVPSLYPILGTLGTYITCTKFSGTYFHHALFRNQILKMKQQYSPQNIYLSFMPSTI